jgi:Na+/H+-translocating membrane pyrophosphatase
MAGGGGWQSCAAMGMVMSGMVLMRHLVYYIFFLSSLPYAENDPVAWIASGI